VAATALAVLLGPPAFAGATGIAHAGQVAGGGVLGSVGSGSFSTAGDVNLRLAAFDSAQLEGGVTTIGIGDSVLVMRASRIGLWTVCFGSPCFKYVGMGGPVVGAGAFRYAAISIGVPTDGGRSTGVVCLSRAEPVRTAGDWDLDCDSRTQVVYSGTFTGQLFMNFGAPIPF
jgi:hypothetical protein